MSKSTKALIVVGWIAMILACAKIMHYEGWKDGFQEGWCHAQPEGTRC